LLLYRTWEGENDGDYYQENQNVGWKGDGGSETEGEDEDESEGESEGEGEDEGEHEDEDESEEEETENENNSVVEHSCYVDGAHFRYHCYECYSNSDDVESAEWNLGFRGDPLFPHFEVRRFR
jgi:cobalamin biosynthesis protein CobT